MLSRSCKGLVLLGLLIPFLLLGCATPTRSNDSESSVDTYEQAVRAYNRAMLERAEPLFLQVISKSPQHYDAHFMLGNIHMRTGSYEAAAHYYEKAIVIEPRDSRAWFNFYLVRIQQAIDTLEAALSSVSTSDPNYQLLLDQLERIYDLHDF